MAFPCDVFFPQIPSNFELRDEVCVTESFKLAGNSSPFTVTIRFKVYENKLFQQ